MKASPLLALSPALRRSRIGNIAITTTTKGILRRTRLEDRVSGGVLFEENHHISRGATLTATSTATTAAVSSTPYKARSNPSSCSSLSPLLGLLNGRQAQTQTRTPPRQSRNPFSTMAAAAPGPDLANASAPACNKESVATPETKTATATTASPVSETEAPLPKLSAADFREYNQMADLMELYVCVSLRVPCIFVVALSPPPLKFPIFR